MTADYIMKCDDDNFIRLDAVLKEIDRVQSARSLYMGNLNLLHRPLRHGKWAVTFEVILFCLSIKIWTYLSTFLSLMLI